MVPKLCLAPEAASSWCYSIAVRPGRRPRTGAAASTHTTGPAFVTSSTSAAVLRGRWHCPTLCHYQKKQAVYGGQSPSKEGINGSLKTIARRLTPSTTHLGPLADLILIAQDKMIRMLVATIAN